MTDLLLASTSPYRRQLLSRLGLPFTSVAAPVDETVLQRNVRDPELLARALARSKAGAVAENRPQAIVIGADQVCSLGDEVLGKPGTTAAAILQLQQLQGRAHRLLTAVAVQRGDQLREFLDVTTLQMRRLDDAEIRRYVDLDQPLDCAGAYKIERAGIALFDRIDSSDHTAIIGLPLLQLAAVLRQFGLPCPGAAPG